MVERNVWHDVNEKERTYIFLSSEGEFSELTFTDVKSIRIGDSGNHRIEYADGMKAIVPPGWKALTLETEKWVI